MAALAIESADARAQPLPTREWTPEAQLWLARALVAEAGWNAPDDHAAIAWVLQRRWQHLHVRWSGLRFVTVVRAYCAGLGHQPASSPRQRWLRRLPWGDPLGRLARYRERWAWVRDFVLAWGRGEILDPCARGAMHWGGHMDRPAATWNRVDCGDTANIFYALR